MTGVGDAGMRQRLLALAKPVQVMNNKFLYVTYWVSMANAAHLLNTPFLVSDPYRFRDEGGHDYLDIGGTPCKLALPWLCCFRQQDLKTVVLQSEDDRGNPLAIRLRVPSTSVSQAIRNLEQALPLFEQVTGETSLARRYWEEALAFLRVLPLPWLTFDALEILGMFDLEGSEDDFVQALGVNARALPYLKGFSCYTDGTLPYPPDVLRHVPGPNKDAVRTGNGVALDCNAVAAVWRRVAGSARERDTAFSMPPRPGQCDLGTVRAAIDALLAERVRNADATYGFARPDGSGKQRLKLLVCAPNDQMNDALLGDQRLRLTLGGPITDDLRAICAAGGLEWRGFVFASEDSLERSFGADINRWVTLASAPAFKRRAPP